MVDHRDVVARASLALDGSLPADSAAEVAEHVRACRDCATYVQQLATTSALVAVRPGRPLARGGGEPAGPPAAEEEGTAARDHRVLTAVARASDPLHADDLVQATWDHQLTLSPGSLPDQEELRAHLLRHIDRHRRDDDAAGDLWADSLLHRHRSHAADHVGSDLPPDPGARDSLRALADLDHLDADADRAELYFPDFYDDGPDRTSWASPPTAWPTVSRILGPDAELGTEELYATVDAALDELPDEVGDVVYLVDIEGHPLERAMTALGLDRGAAQRNLVLGRTHLRGRVASYLSGGQDR